MARPASWRSGYGNHSTTGRSFNDWKVTQWQQAGRSINSSKVTQRLEGRGFEPWFSKLIHIVCNKFSNGWQVIICSLNFTKRAICSQHQLTKAIVFQIQGEQFFVCINLSKIKILCLTW